MDTNTNRQLSEIHQELLETFKARLPLIQEEVENTWSKIIQSGWQEELISRYLQMLHTLIGTSATLGFTQIPTAALALNDILSITIDNKSDALNKQTGEAWQEILQEASGYVDSLVCAIKTEKPRDISQLDTQVMAVQSMKEDRASRLIYLVEDDPIQAQELASQISYFGYKVQVFTRLDELKAGMQLSLPKAILADVVFPEGNTAGPDTIATLFPRPLSESSIRVGSQDFSYPVPLIFISIKSDITSRMQAARAGCDAYFTKPINITSLIDVLDQLTVHKEKKPYRVLIVEDSRTQAKHFSYILEQAGMIVEIVIDPLKIMKPLLEFNPDLVLMDMYMPACTGMELVKVIRQIETFVSLPIVYLSAETNLDSQLDALSLGGDDFLSKTLKADHFIRSVQLRAERYRTLRSLMLNDSLTTLLNHTAIKVRLSQELHRAQRQKCQLSIAMLDLDHFKNVNDRHGHAVGDRVLKSLSNFLKQRLRSSDIIGRYGGEEFIVILPETSASAAHRLLDELRSGFQNIHHMAGNDQPGDFTVTFSCGIASFPDFQTPASISDAADKALYTAKKLGRNRVETHLPPGKDASGCLTPVKHRKPPRAS